MEHSFNSAYNFESNLLNNICKYKRLQIAMQKRSKINNHLLRTNAKRLIGAI